MPNLPHSDLDHSIRSFKCYEKFVTIFRQSERKLGGVSWELEEQRLRDQRHGINARRATSTGKPGDSSSMDKVLQAPLDNPDLQVLHASENMSTSVCEGFTSNASSRRKITGITQTDERSSAYRCLPSSTH